MKTIGCACPRSRKSICACTSWEAPPTAITSCARFFRPSRCTTRWSFRSRRFSPGIHSRNATIPRCRSGRENLVYRAIEAIGGEIGFRGGVHAQLEKRIPVARGSGRRIQRRGRGADRYAAPDEEAECRCERLMEIARRAWAPTCRFFCSGDARWPSIAATRSIRCPTPRSEAFVVDFSRRTSASARRTPTNGSLRN